MTTENKLIDKWLEAIKKTRRARLIEKGLYGAAIEGSRVPKKIRKALPADIIEGAIIWYVMDDGDRYWKYICYVDYPKDQFKAFTADDGCRYGLKNAFVEIKK